MERRHDLGHVVAAAEPVRVDVVDGLVGLAPEFTAVIIRVAVIEQEPSFDGARDLSFAGSDQRAA